MKKIQNPFIRRREWHLRTIIFSDLLKTLLITIALLSALVVLVLVSASNLLRDEILDLYMEQVSDEVLVVSKKEVESIQARLMDVGERMELIRDHMDFFFEHMDQMPVPDMELNLLTHDNGVLYQGNNLGGSSLYYSSDTVMDDQRIEKAKKTALLDPVLVRIVNGSDLVVQAYLNTWDNMNRLYPFMEDGPDQFGPVLHMDEYNFYYLADERHNPEGKRIWTGAYLDPAGQGWMVSCIVPIYNQGRLEGVAGADITLERMINELMQLELPYESNVMILDRSGNIVAMNDLAQKTMSMDELTDHTYDETIKTFIPKPESYNLSHQPRGTFGNVLYDYLTFDTSVRDMRIEDHLYRVHSSAIIESGWVLMIVTDYEVLNDRLENVSGLMSEVMQYALYSLLIIIVVIIVMTSIQSGNIAERLAKPILELKDATCGLGTTLSPLKRIDDRGILEVKELLDQYTMMVHQLDQRTQDLLDKEVERKVQLQLTEKFRNEATKDPLTGIYNRRRLDDIIDGYFGDDRPREGDFSVILMDIDWFKKINDTYGHQVGDEVLVAFTHLVRSRLPEDCSFGRWGGEEFLMVCPGYDEGQAALIAEDIRQAVQNAKWPHGGRLTASFGVSAYQDGDKRTLFNQVDSAVYEAKRISRNCVVKYHES